MGNESAPGLLRLYGQVSRSVLTRWAPYTALVRQQNELAPDDPRHGTTNGYGNLGCRCEACREAHRQNHNRYMKKVRESGQLLGDAAKHGTSYRYDVGCRCDECREAHNEKSRQTKARLRDEGRL